MSKWCIKRKKTRINISAKKQKNLRKPAATIRHLPHILQNINVIYVFYISPLICEGVMKKIRNEIRRLAFRQADEQDGVPPANEPLDQGIVDH
jgi:hypothetical protein